MQIRPIRIDEDHRNALAEIEKLWVASTGTPGGCGALRDRGTRPSQAELADILGSRSRARVPFKNQDQQR